MKLMSEIAAVFRRDLRKAGAAGVVVFAAVAVADVMTPEQLSFTLFYLVPLGILGWFLGGVWPWPFAAAGALLWLSYHLARGEYAYFGLLSSYWEAAVRLGFYAVFIISLRTIRRAITEMARVQGVLRQALSTAQQVGQRYREIFESTSDGVFLLDVEEGQGFRVVGYNPAMEGMVGLTTAAVAGKRNEDFLPPETARSVTANNMRCLAEGAPISFGEELDLPTGHRWWQTTLLPVRDESGRVYRLIGVCQDITETHLAHRALQESEEKFGKAFHASPNSITINRPNGTVIEINSSFTDTFGYGRNDIIGRTMLEVGGWARAEDRDRMHGLLRENKTVTGFETILRCRDGERRTCVLSARTFEIGGQEYFLTIAQDITEKRRMEERHREQEQQIFQSAKLASLGTLVSGIAHEINNPNNYIRLNVQNLQALWPDISATLVAASADRELKLGGLAARDALPLVEGALRGVEEGSRRIEKLVAALRGFARGEEAEVVENVDINAVVDSAVMIVHNVIVKATDAFSLRKDGSLPQVRGGYHQIEQVVINLIANACLALPSRDRKIVVSTRAEAGEWVILEVSDEGVGIPAENIPRLTDPFFTTRRSSGGSGLGLAVSSRIVANHGGTMSFISEVGSGTRVVVRLPAE